MSNPLCPVCNKELKRSQCYNRYIDEMVLGGTYFCDCGYERKVKEKKAKKPQRAAVLVGHFEYSDPYEPPRFVFDEETKNTHGVETLGDLAHLLDPLWDKWSHGSKERSVKFLITIEKLGERND